MSSEFNKRHLANMLYSVPRIVDATNLSVVSNDLMMAFLWYRSDTVESMCNFVNFEYGTVQNSSEDTSSTICGLKFVYHPVFVLQIFEQLSKTDVPASVTDRYTNISNNEWHETVIITIEILRAISTRFRSNLSRTQGMTLKQRALTYRLYAASQAVDDENLATFAENIMAELPDVKSIEYGCVTSDEGDFVWKNYGLKIKQKDIFLSSLLYEFWDTKPPDHILNTYPFLIERGNPRHLPPEFPERIGYTYDNMQCPTFWEMIMFLTCTILESFERVVPIKS